MKTNEYGGHGFLGGQDLVDQLRAKAGPLKTFAGIHGEPARPHPLEHQALDNVILDSRNSQIPYIWLYLKFSFHFLTIPLRAATQHEAL